MLEERKQMRIISTDEKQESSFQREEEGRKECALLSIGLYHCQSEVITNGNRNGVPLNRNIISRKPSLLSFETPICSFINMMFYSFIIFLFLYCWSLPAEYSLQDRKDDYCFIYLAIPSAYPCLANSLKYTWYTWALHLLCTGKPIIKV